MKPDGPLHDQLTASPPVSVKTKSSPEHAGPSLLAEHTGKAFIVTVVEQLPVHPLASVTTTVYVPATAGLTVGFCIVEVKPDGPLHDQLTASPPVSISVTSSPIHTGPLLLAEHVGKEKTVID